ncbi:MAG: apolipoprotein N-acyltransferase [Maioricimonas sp. JB049]
MARKDTPARSLTVPLTCSLAAAACWWAAFPPCSLRWAAWLPPVFWSLILQRRLASASGPDFCERVSLWTGAYLGWLGLLHWMCFPVAWTVGIWMLSAAVLAGLFVLFIETAAQLARSRIPLPLTMAITWTGVEWYRRMASPLSLPFGALEHSQCPHPHVIQLAGLGGDYAVGAVMVGVGALVGQVISPWVPRQASTPTWVGRTIRLLIALALVGTQIGYGHWRLQSARPPETLKHPARTVGLIQSTANLSGFAGPAATDAAFEQCRHLSAKHGSLADLIVWPEAACRVDWIDVKVGYTPPELRHLPTDQRHALITQTRSRVASPLTHLAREAGCPLLINTRVRDASASGLHGLPTNSTLLVDPGGTIGPRYDKIMLAPILEFDPARAFCRRDVFMTSQFRCGDSTQAVAIPIRKNRLPVAADRGAASGDVQRSFTGAVAICFDSFFPEVIRRSITRLTERGKQPDVLIAVSNVGDISRSSAADMLLAAHVYRAVENGIQCITASNAGSSGRIDSNGRLVQMGAAGTAECILVDISRDRQWTLFALVGTVWGQICAGVTGATALLLLCRRLGTRCRCWILRHCPPARRPE